MAKISELRNNYINHQYPKQCPVCLSKLKSTTSRHAYKDTCNNGHILWYFKDSKTLNLYFPEASLREASYSYNKYRGSLYYKDGSTQSIILYQEDLELYQCDGYILELIQNAKML